MSKAPNTSKLSNLQPRQNLVGLGIAFMCASAFMGSVVDVAVKGATAELGTAQIVFLRTLLAIPLALLLCHYQGGLQTLATKRWGWQLYRGILATAMSLGFFYGIANMELVTAMMLLYLSPVLIVLLAKPLLGERVSIAQWLGVLVAFGGVMVVLGPKQMQWNPAALAVLLASLCWALLSLSNRALADTESASSLAFYILPVSLVVTGALAATQWVTPSLNTWLLLLLAGCGGGLLHYFAARAYRHTNAATVAPFEYTTLLWAALAAFYFWDELPEATIWIGGTAIIVGGCISSLKRTGA